MTKLLIFQLLALCQFAFGQQSSCPGNGPEKIKIRAQYNIMLVDKNGCPQNLTHPNEGTPQLERCRFISNDTDGDYKRENYQCDFRPQFDRLVDNAIKNN
ncbi:hypothetical protein CONCODRAFT_10555 [Conidiobolus coronatus NRRL 28638]|uniref:Uncharacterized protein n=1 Tax=Conidiobolus coronatus (strain ATCC 28846 / CBS 209.66 / NRRL 28638) TaxID=796925 RepID=A0A137NXM8_CONC2|nr:hypothetical protein CONCODRAFT_10555 [Conidiobolus coronatus NRRL 28638]|eukprot:KXN67379.1 hypothetical protein CONCODRAFT_10555 [Conidiobolus coronatus NRRL 28638]